jgi:hypothetical protein
MHGISGGRIARGAGSSMLFGPVVVWNSVSFCTAFRFVQRVVGQRVVGQRA